MILKSKEKDLYNVNITMELFTNVPFYHVDSQNVYIAIYLLLS
jgi:hypothetical protein